MLDLDKMFDMNNDGTIDDQERTAQFAFLDEVFIEEESSNPDFVDGEGCEFLDDDLNCSEIDKVCSEAEFENYAADTSDF